MRPGNKAPRLVEEVDWDNWQPAEKAVLCYVLHNGEVLLIHKKKGLGAGKINAPGGRINPGESPLEAAVRETEEETGIRPVNPVEMAELSFIFTDGYSLHGRIFVANQFKHTQFTQKVGTLVETDEAFPFWCSQEKIPYEDMWEDDAHWLPHVLEGKYVKGFFVFEGDRMLSKRVVF
jgi:8-oxo-dGTP diphosphatase